MLNMHRYSFEWHSHWVVQASPPPHKEDPDQTSCDHLSLSFYRWMLLSFPLFLFFYSIPLIATSMLQYPSPTPSALNINTTSSDSSNATSTLQHHPSNNDNTLQQGRSRGLSLSLTGANAGLNRENGNNNSTSSLPSPPKIAQPSTVSIQFDCAQQLVLRPGRIVRGMY